jgi:hypothetical protein
VANALVLLTEPGWAFACQAGLHSSGGEADAFVCHRDSTLVVAASTPAHRLRTPSQVLGSIVTALPARGRDATETLGQRLRPELLKRAALGWLPHASKSELRRYSISSELWGRTSMYRHEVTDAVRSALRRAFPAWRELPDGGLKFVCKADPDVAVLGVQLHTNLDREARREASPKVEEEIPLAIPRTAIDAR